MVGTIAAIKATGERVFVLSETSSGLFYQVRRASVGQNGITHTVETFQKDELETVEESMNREFDEQILKNKIGTAKLAAARREMQEAGAAKDVSDNKILEFPN